MGDSSAVGPPGDPPSPRKMNGTAAGPVGRSRLIVFTKWPAPGRVKTRLIPALGAEGAAALQRAMTEHTLRWARHWAEARAAKGGAAPESELEVRFDGASEGSVRDWLGGGLRYVPQVGGDLGARMNRAFADAFAEGCARVALVGTDCPGLNASLVDEALDALAGCDLALGPSRDGGYYLIALRRSAPDLFAGVVWGSGDVLRATLERAHPLGLSVHRLPELCDVDTPDDLPVWQNHKSPSHPFRNPQSATQHSQSSISIIIPALDEAGELAATLLALNDDPHVLEVIVVDGGSRDASADVARRLGARLLASPAGRARQCNAGAAVARGAYYLFLHADTRLPAGFGRLTLATLARPGVAAGAFHLRIDAPGASLRLIERAANARARRLQLPYGDQGLFLRAETFRAAGGYPDQPIMDDYELVRRLRRLGRIELAPGVAVTSARRWRRQGVWRTTWLHQRILVGYWLGLSLERLARWRD